MTTSRVLLIFAVAILAASCQTAPETIGAVGAGVAGLAAVFTELAGGGVISPVQNLQAQHALEAISQTMSAAQQAAQLAQKTAEAAEAGGINPSEFAAGLAGAVGTGAVALNSWRNLTRKKDIKSAKVA